MKKSKSAFTLVELMVAVAVVLILAAITIVMYDSIQTKATASATVADLKSTEDTFRLYFMRQGFTTWPRENDDFPGSASIQDYIDNAPGFRNYMAEPPKSDPGSEWQYDNDNPETKNMPCGNTDNINKGVNIAIKTGTRKITEEIDRMIDGGDGNLCGRFRWFEDGSRQDNAYYNLSPGRDDPLN